MSKIVFARQELQAAALFVSNDEARHVLNGVLVEVRENWQAPLLVATDGRRLVTIESQAEQRGLAEEGKTYFTERNQFILRPDMIEQILFVSKKSGAKNNPWIMFEYKQSSPRLDVTFIGTEAYLGWDAGAIIEGNFPNWQTTLPPKELVRAATTREMALNAEFVADFAKAAKILEATSPAIQMDIVGREGAVQVHLSGLRHFYALIMQCKLDDTVEYQPEFIDIVRDLPAASALTEQEDDQSEDAGDGGDEEAEQPTGGLTSVAEAVERAEEEKEKAA